MRIKQVWYSPKAKLASPDTVHQILMFGNLPEIQSLKKNLGEQTVKELFLHFPKKIYTQSTLNFIKKLILKVQNPIDEQKYLKNTPRSA